MSRVAMCRTCKGEPLVSTFDFSKKEFICLGCGRLYEWLHPAGADETPELLAKMEQRREEWRRISEGHLPTGAKLSECDACRTFGDYSHRDHATSDELAEHDLAVKRIAVLRHSGGAS